MENSLSFQKEGNLKFKNALQNKIQKCPPIWLMRQAGRYHRHYQSLRKKHDFMSLCKNPKLAAETALGPILDFDFDVAILFSDLLFPLEGLGLELHYRPEPHIERHFTKDILRKTNSVEEIITFLKFQEEAIVETRKVLPKNKSLVGFVGGIWTLFCYAVEGNCSGNLTLAKKALLEEDGLLFRAFCDKILPALKHSISAQLNKGAEIVYIFDTAAGQLSEQMFKYWIVPILSELSLALPNQLAYFAKGVTKSHYDMNYSESHPWAGFVYDQRWSISSVLKAKTKALKQKTILNPCFIQGNFDPVLLQLPKKEFSDALKQYLDLVCDLNDEERAGWVCSLGHGVLPGTPEENVRSFVTEVRDRFS